MKIEKVGYEDAGTELEGHLVWDDSVEGPRPLVLVAHAWAGQGELERAKAGRVAELGYAAFATDMYGRGVLGRDADENAARMAPFAEDRARLRQRMRAGLEAASSTPVADRRRVAAIGFCFGGMCVLELARGGAEIAGVVAFHGLLQAAALSGDDELPVSARVLALHGHDDPMAPPEQVLAFEQEMSARGADWQVHVYGNTQHAFTNPSANDPGFGTVYDESSDRRSWAAMRAFLQECFA